MGGRRAELCTASLDLCFRHRIAMLPEPGAPALVRPSDSKAVPGSMILLLLLLLLLPGLLLLITIMCTAWAPGVRRAHAVSANRVCRVQRRAAQTCFTSTVGPTPHRVYKSPSAHVADLYILKPKPKPQRQILPSITSTVIVSRIASILVMILIVVTF